MIAEMGGKDAIVVDREADLDSAVTGVVQSAYGYQGQKCSACSRAIVDAAVYDQFLEKVQDEGGDVTVGPAGGSGELHGSGDQRGREKNDSRIHRNRQERRPFDRGRRRRLAGEGYFIQPTVIADVDSKARIFQEEIFGPVSGGDQGARFRSCDGTRQRYANTG